MKDEFNKFCEEHRIQRQFLVAKIPQQNGVVRRKNRMVQETKITMLIEGKLPQKFWREAVGAVIYILNRAQLKVNCDKTPYELWKGNPTLVNHFRIFGSVT